MKCIASGTGERGYGAAQSSAVAGFESSRLDLNLLKVFKNSILARPSVNGAVGGNSIDQERALGSACPVYLDAPLDFANADMGARIAIC